MPENNLNLNYYFFCVMSKGNCFFFSSRNLQAFFSLFFLNTRLPSNEKMIARIQKETLSSTTLEALLESAPQFILQCSIIWRTGNLSKLF
jgi:hypothetical protein